MTDIHSNEKKELNEMQTDNLNFLHFSLGKEEYAIPLLSVIEVIAATDVTPVPFTPKHFLGVVNLRGQMISVIDLAMKLKIPSQENSPEAAFIICDTWGSGVGVKVDAVNGVLILKPEDIAPAPEVSNSDKNIMGIYKKSEKLILLLNITQYLATEFSSEGLATLSGDVKKVA